MTNAPEAIRDTNPTAERPSSGRFWIAFVVSLLAGQVILILVMVYVATNDASFAVEPDYYRKGLRWDETAAQLRRNEALQWSITATIADEHGAGGKRHFSCRLMDASGDPLDGAAIDVVAFAHARGQDRLSFPVPAVGEGDYEATVPLTRPGLWEFRFVVRRGPDVFTHRLLRRVK